MTIEKVRELFKNDRFATENGMVIESAGDGEAVCTVELNDSHLNAAGSIQGGVIFTLADFAFAVAANCERMGTVTLASTVNFLRPPKGQKLSARAVPRHRGRTTNLYIVEVTDEEGTLVAQLSITGYTVAEK